MFDIQMTSAQSLQQTGVHEMMALTVLAVYTAKSLPGLGDSGVGTS